MDIRCSLDSLDAMQESWKYVWDVESAEEPGGRVRVSLVRRRERHFSRHLAARTETVERTVLFSRAFRPLLETVSMEHYAAQLELVARHAREGQFGCFIQNLSEDGTVEVILYDRWFDDPDIRTEELARHAFDATDENSLVASAEFVADLRIWAERRNEEREAAVLEQSDADDARRQSESEREAASRELSEILAAHTREP
jgi:hypothetical protein